jgi:acyl transferase domain-containing protein/SAM-dependent methyltransferase/acyl carrier protein
MNTPQAYQSVSYDENRATITASQANIPALQNLLRASGVTATKIGLLGRFHWQGHEEVYKAVLAFCDNHPLFCLPDASELVRPTRLNSGDEPLTEGRLHEAALKAILLDHSDWITTFTLVQSTLPLDKGSKVVSFGPERCIPPSILKALDADWIHYEDLMRNSSPTDRVRDNDIAVVGMACTVAGAQDVGQFWKILMEGKSQHVEVPTDRFGFETVFRPEPDTKRKWYGNFIDDQDAFDHKFFKKTPREAASMDPQQRLLLQIAYQAVEQSGYFHDARNDKQIGCYIGVCATDYENNVAHHAPTAFSATGNLRSFIAGKISHYFGWTGPGLTIDTACSASAVSIHQACRAILSGECSAALAGGTNFISSPLWFQNLAAASFLSPTGQCKPFDAKADGYCRGEAIAAVFLKKASQAILDGNQILGIISGTAVLQNQNCTPIFVPNAPSLSELFRTVVAQSGLDAQQISVVEAHGTGTPVGDPAEYDSIRQVFGGRAGEPLQFGSVKGLVGHTEGSSGVVSLIKVLLMMQKGYIPPQASFSTMSHSIKATSADNMQIATVATPWKTDFRAALINNYGASGSNASMVVKQAPPPLRPGQKAGSIRYPFYLSGSDDRSIQAYISSLRELLLADRFEIEDLSFNLSRQTNRSLERALVFSCQSLEELDDKLASVQTLAPPSPPPVILCFGGQVSTYVGLNREVYDRVTVFRQHLDHCDLTCRTLGADSIYPGIFRREPVANPSRLQPMLFAIQYACAMSWIDCGVNPAALVGHSFGELTALCVSGILSLRDALGMVLGRSRLIRDHWGAEKGAMMAVEGDLEEVEKLLIESCRDVPGTTPATIACFNGPRSFTLAGSVESIDAVTLTITTNGSYSLMKFKRLNVTNAFHSTLVEHLKPSLEDVGRSLTFHEPKIPLERATEARETRKLDATYVAEHMRNPVYFNHAVQRLSKQYPSAVWLEAGSNSTITAMASRALGAPKNSHFQPINITSDGALQHIIDSTMTLWKTGLRVSFWGHSKAQTHEYSVILLPPYQFEKSRHWLEFKTPPKLLAPGSTTDTLGPSDVLPSTLWTFTGYEEEKQGSPRFRINTTNEKYENLVSGHVIAKTAPICPATLQIDMATEAIMSIRPDLSKGGLHPQILNVSNQAPICMDPSRSVWMVFQRLDHNPGEGWYFRIFSEGAEGAHATTHVTGEIAFHALDDAQYQQEFSRYERLVHHQRCLQLLAGEDADDIIQGRTIYKVFSEVVDYSPTYFGLLKLVGRGSESAGQVVKKHSGETWLDPLLGDCFSQVGGIWVNCMANQSTADMFIASGFEKWFRSPKLLQGNRFAEQDVWHVLAHHDCAASGSAFLTDIFIFDAATGALAEVILGINYTRVPKLSMSRLLTRLTPGLAKSKHGEEAMANLEREISNGLQLPVPATVTVTARNGPTPDGHAINGVHSAGSKSRSSSDELLARLKGVLADIVGQNPGEIKNDVELADIGIDSLMGMEMAREIESTFKCTLDNDELMLVTDLPGLFTCLRSALGIVDDGPVGSLDGDSDDNSSSSPDTKTNSGERTAIDTPNSSAASIDPGEPSSEENADHSEELLLPASIVLDAFRESKARTDQCIEYHNCSGYLDSVMPQQTTLCVALTVEAFQQLGCDLASAPPGQELEKISHLPEHGRLADYLYTMLEETRVVDLKGDHVVRTAIPLPSKRSDEILKDLLRSYPDHAFANELVYWTGSKLADVLSGKADGLKLIFGNERGRELVAGLYGESLLNKLSYQQMADFLHRLLTKVSQSELHGTLKILEMGAGTGGTTKWLVPLLAKLGVPVEYTFTDLSPSFVVMARKKFKEYPFMKFMVHDIEKPPADAGLLHSQHIVIASNAIHATHSLSESTKNAHKFLRPDGFLMMLEMTETLYWVDLIFGVLEGWWLFDDGRTHAIAHETRWEKELYAAGYGHVDWTDGDSAEVRIQKIFIALASRPEVDRPPAPSKSTTRIPVTTNHEARRAATDDYIRRSVQRFSIPERVVDSTPPGGICVLVTGATGSLGSHLVSHLASLPAVHTVICLNRRSKSDDPTTRQIQALESKGIIPDAFTLSKLKVIETDTAQPLLGLAPDSYEDLLNSVTHIVHNAWPMSGKRPLKGFERQFQVMRNLVDLAAGISARRPPGSQVVFQFVSSIPRWATTRLRREQRASPRTG